MQLMVYEIVDCAALSGVNTIAMQPKRRKSQNKKSFHFQESQKGYIFSAFFSFLSRACRRKNLFKMNIPCPKRPPDQSV